MTTVYEVPAKEFIDEISKKLKKDDNIKIPEENIYSKTGVNRENSPKQKNWWYTRCASILRKIYINDTIGVERLRTEYSGRLNRGSKPHKTRPGSGSIIRRAVQQLEKAGYISKVKGKGRMLTSKGRSFMDNTAHDLSKKL